MRRAQRGVALVVGAAMVALAITGAAWGWGAMREVVRSEVAPSDVAVTSEPSLNSDASLDRPDASGEATLHIAMMRDFEGFTAWSRYAVEGAMLPVGVADGPTHIYANRSPPRGRSRWPVGTILVKVIESGPQPDAWTIHAMVKRGLPFNADGAVGWEYFELALEPGSSRPTIRWRGPGPPSGHGYAAANRDAGTEAIPLVCNDCHGAAWRNDGVLTPALALR